MASDRGGADAARGASPQTQPGNLNDPAGFTVTLKAGAFIFREQDTGRDMFIICRGQVTLTKQYAGEERMVERLDAGDFFGEMSLLEEQPREVSARATTDCELFRIDASTFDLLVQEAPEIPVRMLQKLSRRLRVYQEHEARAAAIAMAPLTGSSPDLAEAAAKAQAAATPAPPSREPAPEAAGAAWLVALASGARIALGDRDEVMVGRSDRSGFTPDVDLTTIDTGQTVGRRHAKILRREGAHFLREEQARNGTFLNGARVEPRAEIKLAHGDQIRFGLVETRFEIGADAPGSAGR